MNRVRKSIDIPEKELKKLQILAVYEGVSIKVLLENIILEYAKRNKNSFESVKK